LRIFPFFTHISGSEVDRRHSARSFVAQKLSALGVASLDAAHCGTASPRAPKHDTESLALNSGSWAYGSLSIGVFCLLIEEGSARIEDPRSPAIPLQAHPGWWNQGILSDYLFLV
jgi:hypothetical protein